MKNDPTQLHDQSVGPNSDTQIQHPLSRGFFWQPEHCFFPPSFHTWHRHSVPHPFFTIITFMRLPFPRGLVPTVSLVVLPFIRWNPDLFVLAPLTFPEGHIGQAKQKSDPLGCTCSSDSSDGCHRNHESHQFVRIQFNSIWTKITWWRWLCPIACSTRH